MKIDSYLQNHDAQARKNTLIEISITRVLTEAERLELDTLIGALNDFQDRIVNFD